MKHLILFILAAALWGVVVAEEPSQTFFIYPDRTPHEAPADEATIQLCTLSDTTQIAAYAGAVWGEHDLSGRSYCLAWAVSSADEFDQFLMAHGYRRLPSIAEP